jgi:hypothetical protein
MTPKQKEVYEAVQKYGGIRAAAKHLGLVPSGVHATYYRALRDIEQDKTFESLGYDIEADTSTSPEEAWNSHKTSFERVLAKSKKSRSHTIERAGPFCIFHATDEHIDDDKVPLSLLECDINAAHDMGAIMCHGGDLLNNWPMAGRLAKQWAEQDCTLASALLRAQHFIDIFKPNFWVDGNHEEMNPYLVNLFDEWLKPHDVARDYWRIDFTVNVEGGRDLRVAMSHKFQKGSSWFHKSHGHIREMLEGDDIDLYMDGHIHSDGVMDHTLPERQHSSLLVSSAGYKVMDKYATRISRGGIVPKLRGRAHWIICDPFADYDANLVMAFKDPVQAEAYLNSLQNLRMF